MLYKEFLLRLAELVEESDDPLFYLCSFCDEVRFHLSGVAGAEMGEAAAAYQMLQAHPQWMGIIADHAAYLKKRIHKVETRKGTFGNYVRGRWPALSRNARRVAWLREEAAQL